MARHRLAGLILASMFALLIAGIASADDCLRAIDWVDAEGKDAAWMAATAKVRGLLEKIDVSDPKLARWMPAVKRRSMTLGRLTAIGGLERAAFLDTFETMLEDLAAGRPPLTSYAGQTIAYGYWSRRMCKLVGTRVQVPADYDPAKEYQFFMYYKLGGGLYWKKDGKFCAPDAEGARPAPPYQPTAEMCRENSPQTFHAWSALYYGLKGRMGCDTELMEIVPALTQDFAISPDRVFLSGFSDGGFTSLWLASRYPHLLAGIAPEVANWQYGNVEHVGLYNVPVLVVDGWRDGGYVQENFARLQILSSMGYDFNGLFGHHGHQTAPYENAETFKQIMAWAATKRRDLNPRRVRYATWNLAWHRAFWFNIERMIEPALAAQIDGQIKDGNRIDVEAHNVAAYTLSLNNRLVDPAKPVTVFTNGAQSYAGPFKAELTVEVAPFKLSRLSKSPATPGGITVAMTRSTYDSKGFLKTPDRPWTWVRPTGGSEADRKALAAAIPDWAVDDSAVDDERIAQSNLFIIGGPGLNKLADRMAAELPVKFEKGRFRIGEKVYDRPQHSVKFICPNPLNPEKHVIVYGFNDPVRRSIDKFTESSWGFRVGDCLVLGVESPANDFGAEWSSRNSADYCIFDANWQPPDPKPLGTAEAPFDLLSIHVLRADAIAEATGADAGVIGGVTPGWNRWRTWIPAGPITLNDLATTSMFPDYVLTCEVSGATLRNMVAGRKKVFAHSLSPEQVAALDDTKSYRIATDYGTVIGQLGYGVEVDRMPKPFFYFRDLKEFAAQSGASLNCSNLRQLTLQTTEAMAAWVKKRGRVSPRPVRDDLACYIANPQANRFEANDWLHLSMTAPLADARTGRSATRRVTLGIGLAADGNRQGETQRFERLALDGKEVAGSYDLAKLAGRLPVEVSVKVSRLRLVGACDGSEAAVKLAAGGGVGRETFLATVTLTNKGDTKVDGRIVLGSPSVTRVNGSTFSTQPDAPGDFCQGYVDTLGPRDRSYQVDASLLVSPKVAADEKIVLPAAGFNSGLVGLARPLTLEPGATERVGVLFLSAIAADPAKPGAIDLGRILGQIKSDLMAEMK